MNSEIYNLFLHYSIPAAIIGWCLAVHTPIQNILAKLPRHPTSGILQKIAQCPKCAGFNICLVWSSVDAIWYAGPSFWHIIACSALSGLTGAFLDKHLNQSDINL